MKYRFVLTIIFCCLFLSCLKEIPKTKQNIIIVKVAPIYNGKLSNEENYWRFRHFLFPQEEIPNPIPEGLPNDDSLLYVSIEKDGNVKVNSQDMGSVSDTNYLTWRLKEVFQERKKNKVYEPDSQKVVKAVGIEADFSIKYGEFIKVVEAVKASGAEPIVLLFDNDARMVPVQNLK